MANIPHAGVSPRISGGAIFWYEGDTFDITLELELTDQDGDEITLGASDQVVVTFRDISRAVVKTFTFTNVTSNTITMDFDATATALFPKGVYAYDIAITQDDRTTIANENKVVVE